MMESLYFGTPLLGFGQDGDQFGAIGRMKRLGVARFGYPDSSPEDLFNQIAEMLYDGEIAQTARREANRVMRLMEFEELRQGNMMVQQIDYTIKFGSTHLLNTSVRHDRNAMYDLDIKFVLLAIIYIFYRLLKMMLCSKPKA